MEMFQKVLKLKDEQLKSVAAERIKEMSADDPELDNL